MTYNALDNAQKAYDLIQQLILEKEDIIGSVEYNEATGGENWSYEDSQRMEIEIAIIARLIAALHNYMNRREGKSDE